MSLSRRLTTSPLAWSLALALGLGACSSHGQPREASDAELAPVDVDASGRPIDGAAASPAPTPAAKPGTPAADTPAPPPAATGPVATVLYVCEIGNKVEKRPAVAIFSSDPSCPYMNERPRPTRILKPLGAWKMGQLLADLDRAGLQTLPVEEQPLDQRIEADRQIIIIRDGKRIDYRKLACKQDPKLYETFARCERVLVGYSSGSDTFVETEGLAPIPGH